MCGADGGRVCKRWLGGRGGGGSLDCCSSWLAAGLVSMATCVKRVHALSLSPVLMLCTKNNVLQLNALHSVSNTQFKTDSSGHARY